VRGRRTFEDFVRRYRKRAFRFAYRLCGRADEADDLVQEAFRRVLSEWHRYDPSRPLSTWYFTILRHLFLDNRKRHERRRAVPHEWSAANGGVSGVHYAELLPQREDAVLEQLEREETALLVRRTLRRLNCEHRAVLTLCCLQGLKYKEAAQALDVPLGTVRSRVSRARTAFRQRYVQVTSVGGRR